MNQEIFQYIIANKKIVHRKIDMPLPNKNEVLIKVRAAGINRADLLQVQGIYRTPEKYENLPGLEVAGEIVRVGNEVNHFNIGEKVCGLLPGGGYSEYVILNQDMILPMPSHLNYVEAASLPESIYTFYLNFFWPKSIFKPHDKLLVTGGASGISALAIQLAKYYNMQVCALVSNEEKKEFCQKLGADLIINYRKENFVHALKLSNFFPDIVLDMYGGEFIEKYLYIINYEGKILLIGVMNNSITSFSLGRLLIKNVAIIGKTLRSQTTQTKTEMTKELLHKVWPLIEQNKIRPYVSKIFSFEKIEEAHNFMQLNKHFGKIVLSE